MRKRRRHKTIMLRELAVHNALQVPHHGSRQTEPQSATAVRYMEYFGEEIAAVYDSAEYDGVVTAEIVGEELVPGSVCTPSWGSFLGHLGLAVGGNDMREHLEDELLERAAAGLPCPQRTALLRTTFRLVCMRALAALPFPRRI